MSATDFINTFHNTLAYKRWYANNTTWAKSSREALTKQGVSNRVDFALNEITAESLGIAEKFNELARTLKTKEKTDGAYLVADGKNPLVIIFPDLNFDTGISAKMDSVFGVGTYDKAREQDLVKGHVVGFATGGLVGVSESLKQAFKGKLPTGVTRDTFKGAINFLNVLEEHLSALDIESSSFRNHDVAVTAKYRKSSSKFLVEFQGNTENLDSAKDIAKLVGKTVNPKTGIRTIFNPSGATTKAVENLLELLVAQGMDPKKVLELKTSPAMIQIITDELVNDISRKSTKKAEYIENVNLGTLPLITVDNASKAKQQRELKKQLAEVKKAKQKVLQAENKAKKAALRTPKGQFTSIASIQSIINQKLEEQIKKNMGKGAAHNTLNNRTGRFAASARVTQLTMGKEGTLTAFYSYMKYPYQTFEPGFAQGLPESRDPKKLITKSIREIAISLATTRLRTILV